MFFEGNCHNVHICEHPDTDQVLSSASQHDLFFCLILYLVLSKVCVHVCLLYLEHCWNLSIKFKSLFLALFFFECGDHQIFF